MSSSICTFSAAMKSCRTLEDAPGAVVLEADAQVGGDQLAVAELELVSRRGR